MWAPSPPLSLNGRRRPFMSSAQRYDVLAVNTTPNPPTSCCLTPTEGCSKLAHPATQLVSLRAWAAFQGI